MSEIEVEVTEAPPEKEKLLHVFLEIVAPRERAYGIGFLNTLCEECFRGVTIETKSLMKEVNECKNYIVLKILCVECGKRKGLH